MDWKHILFSFQGRINRAKWWLALLILLVFGLVMGILSAVAGSSSAVGTAISVIEAAVNLYVGLATATKRLHDRDKSAWWLLLFYVVPGVLAIAAIALGVGGAIFSDQAGGAGGAAIGVAVILGLAAFAVGLWGFIEIACLRGTPGPNRFGPDPLEPVGYGQGGYGAPQAPYGGQPGYPAPQGPYGQPQPGPYGQQPAPYAGQPQGGVPNQPPYAGQQQGGYQDQPPYGSQPAPYPQTPQGGQPPRDERPVPRPGHYTPPGRGDQGR